MTLIEAIEAADLEAVKERLGAKDDPNALGAEGKTPLMRAAELGHDPIVEVLLYAGAEATLADSIGETALLKAAAQGHRAVMKRLEPLVSDDEVAQARAFLAAVGMTHGPEKEIEERFLGLKNKVARAGAAASALVGDENPQSRIDRILRAEKKKR